MRSGHGCSGLDALSIQTEHGFHHMGWFALPILNAFSPVSIFRSRYTHFSTIRRARAARRNDSVSLDADADRTRRPLAWYGTRPTALARPERRQLRISGMKKWTGSSVMADVARDRLPCTRLHCVLLVSDSRCRGFQNRPPRSHTNRRMVRRRDSRAANLLRVCAIVR